MDDLLCVCTHRHVSQDDPCDYPGCGCTIFEQMPDYLDAWAWPGSHSVTGHTQGGTDKNGKPREYPIRIPQQPKTNGLEPPWSLHNPLMPFD